MGMYIGERLESQKKVGLRVSYEEFRVKVVLKM